MTERDILERLTEVLAARRDADPERSYVAGLYAGGREAILAKIEEEAAEVLAAGHESDDGHLVREVADLWFHCMVLLLSRGLTPDDVLAELARRFGVSGLDEKAARGQGG
jgi:phosphoribosyl-ATP pyrophosphohydrolase